MLNRDFVQRITKSDAAPAKKEETTFELTNLRVEEVSLVDRPANQRTFLVKKRDHKKTEAPADKGKEGEAVVVDADEVVDIAALGKGEAPGADLDRADAEKKKAEQAAEEAAEREREKQIVADVDAKAAKAASEGTPPGDPPEKAADKPAGDPPPATEKPAGDPPPAADPPAPAVPPADQDVAKVGKPMARKRLERLKASFQALGELIGELDVDAAEEPAAKRDDEDAKRTKRALSVLAELEKAKAGTTFWLDGEWLKAQESPAAPVEPAVKNDGNNAEIARLAALVEALQQMVKSQGEQLAKSQQPVNSNAISLEKTDYDHDKVSWEYDLASPAARLKGRSF